MAEWQRGYRTVTPDQTTALDALSCGAVRELEESLNATIAACSPKLVGEPLLLTSDGDAAGEVRVQRIIGPIRVPGAYDTLSIALGHELESGAGQVDWALYCLPAIYVGTRELDTSLLGSWYDSVSVGSTTSGTHAIATVKRGLDIKRSANNEIWLMLTAESDDGSTAKATTLDVTAEYSGAYS